MQDLTNGSDLDLRNWITRPDLEDHCGPDLPYGFLGFSPGPCGFKGPPDKSSQSKIDDMRKEGGPLSSISPGPHELTVRPWNISSGVIADSRDKVVILPPTMNIVPALEPD
ncbi:hypothetical protein EVAR_36331_1 [Eumeta japonica]|uniref:Uncharacterized protein n=1 Tax=Eumeta variegata TaxID=151549 RepID=A0A4C1VGZ2_EUMVA|nr:hypothetical protein EVAR_36331_1 [Eumeta japonica]